MDPNQEQQEQRNQPGILDQLNRYANFGRKARRKGLAKNTERRALSGGGRVVARGLMAFFRTPLGLTILGIIAIFILVFIILFFFILPDTNSQPAQSPPLCTAPVNQPITMDEFFTLFDVKDCPSIDAGVYATCVDASTSHKDYIYNILAVPLASQKYKQLLTAKGKITIYLRPPIGSVGSTTGGAEYGGDIIQYWGYTEAGDTLITRTSVVHETGHIIRTRNPELNTTFPIHELAQKDSSCYTDVSSATNARPQDKGPYINTYANKINGVGGGYFSETLAELIGMSSFAGPGIKYDKGLPCTSSNYPNCSQTIENYPTTCPNTYNWIKENIYGGVDLFGGGGSGNTCTAPADLTSVVGWATTIASNLASLGNDPTTGDACLYNVQANSGICSSSYCAATKPGLCGGDSGSDLPYYCTQLVKDSYNLSGRTNNFSLGALNMRDAWAPTVTTGWDAIKILKPGDVIFLWDDFQHGHVQIVSSTTLNQDSQSGFVNIVQANSHSTTSTLTISNGEPILGSFFTHYAIGVSP